MFHAHQSEFTELGWMGFFEVCEQRTGKLPATCPRARADGGRQRADADDRRPRRPFWVLGLAPLLLVLVLGAIIGIAGPGLGDRTGLPAEELVVERTVLRAGTIELVVRNDGPDAVRVAQATVNDAFVDVQRGRRRDRPPRRPPGDSSTTRGSRARPTRSRCSPRRAARSRTRSPSRPRRPTSTSASSA